MGRLFWKFFLIFWLAQVVTAVGVGIAVWLAHPAFGPAPAAFGGGSPPAMLNESGPSSLSKPLSHAVEPPPHHLPPPPTVPFLAGSIVSLLFAALLAWYFAKPIRSLRAAFESVARGRFETRIGASMGRRNDELADLGQDFDHMAGRLESLIDAQRRLLHDVSHELRSPLARLQAAADLMRQQPERGSEFVERIERDTTRMDKLVGELLTLARLDTGMAGNLDEEADLCEIIAGIAEDAQFEADGKRCTIELDLNGPVVTRGNSELLHRAVENVVRNAVRHSREGGVITVTGAAVKGGLRVSVADGGPGVPDRDLGSIFEPFFRSDPSRTAAGHGLGLAITRRVVEAHGGTVSAANRPEGGLLVTLDLPNR
jgi:signal transduction histidine kinase